MRGRRRPRPGVNRRVDEPLGPFDVWAVRPHGPRRRLRRPQPCLTAFTMIPRSIWCGCGAGSLGVRSGTGSMTSAQTRSHQGFPATPRRAATTSSRKCAWATSTEWFGHHSESHSVHSRKRVPSALKRYWWTQSCAQRGHTRLAAMTSTLPRERAHAFQLCWWGRERCAGAFTCVHWRLVTRLGSAPGLR